MFDGIWTVLQRHRDVLAHIFFVLGVAAYILLLSVGPEAIGGRGERFRAVFMPIVMVYAATGCNRRGSEASRASLSTYGRAGQDVSSSCVRTDEVEYLDVAGGVVEHELDEEWE